MTNNVRVINMPTTTRIQPVPARLISRCGGMFLGGLILSALAVAPAMAEANVRTLGGGRLTPSGPDAGFIDGDILQAAQFNQPFSCAVDAAGRVYVADRGNGAVRRLDTSANRCRTLIDGLQAPVAVALDSTGVLFVLTSGDGAILKLDRGVMSQVAAGLFSPTAMALYGTDSLLVTEASGSLVQVSLVNGSVSPLMSGLIEPGGIAVLESGFIAIAETGVHVVRIWDPMNWTVKLQVGGGTGGFADGPPSLARFNRPYQLAKAPGGNLLIADRANHRVRMIDRDGFVSTLYGVDPGAWEGPACTSCNPVILPGWFDGSVEFAEARDPVGVVVSEDGKIYTTEAYYHLVREITGATFDGTGGGGSTNNVVLPPAITPDSGYYPMGQVITVSNPNVSSLLSSAVYYTTDGSEPSTNSIRVHMESGIGNILWREKQRDLASLRVRAFLGGVPSATVSGRAMDVTEIGVPQNVAAGIGSTAIIPVVINLRTNDQFQSLQFRVEVTPASPGVPMVPETLAALSFSTNDSIPLFTAETKGEARFQSMSYTIDQTRGLAITFIGTNSNFLIKGFGVAAMLAVPIPPTAKVGDRYTIQAFNPSGTADGMEQGVAVVPMPARTLIVSESRYLVGDSSPASWYNATQLDASDSAFAGFGDGVLDNRDVNNAFSAALGLRVPYPHTDLFDAMDAFPADTAANAGGDGLIRYLDWQVILMRALGLDSERWERSWSDGGIRVTQGSSLAASANQPGAILVSPPPGAVWTPEATLFGQQAENVAPGTTVDLPIHVRVAPGFKLAGLAFRAVVSPEGAAPSLERPLQFIPNPNIPAPAQSVAPNLDSVLCGWPLAPSHSFNPALHGANLLGHVRVGVPAGARSGDAYTLRFSNADGSPDLQTQYQFETKTASLWVSSSALRPAEVSSDQWKTQFFGSVTADIAAADADPDGDGAVNAVEYLAGTNPADARSRLHLMAAPIRGAASGVVLTWLSAPGKDYQIECAPSMLGSEWTVVASNLTGDGLERQWIQTNLTSITSFYRIRLQAQEIPE